jgi:hypothetical protein
MREFFMFRKVNFTFLIFLTKYISQKYPSISFKVRLAFVVNPPLKGAGGCSMVGKKRNSYRRNIVLIFLSFINFNQSFSQIDSIQIIPSKDNSIFSESGSLSDGKGLELYAGRVFRGSNVRRALLKFDLSSVPTNVQIQGVKLTLTTIKAADNQTTPHNFTLHKMLSNWGEGTSTGLGNGSPATTNDATWQNTFYPSANWTTNGGDFVSTASATAVGIKEELIIWNSPQMLNDLNAWISSPSTNYGWMIRGEESVQGSAKAFVSREGLNVFPRTLTIYYSLPLVEKAFINEVNPKKQWVEIFNPNKPTINLSNYYLANGTSTIQLNNTLILNGNLTIDSGKYTVIKWSGINLNDGELALYNGNPANGGTLMKDYIQYGSGNHQSASAAVTAQVWDNATAFLLTISSDSSSYSVNGNNNYSSGIATTFASYLIQRQTPSLKNLICPTQLNLTGNIVDSKYTTSGSLKLIGNATSTSTIKLFSSQFIEIQPVSLIDKGGFFEVKVGSCSSN